MVKYAVVSIYGKSNGEMTGYSKPDKTFDTLGEVRLFAKKFYNSQKGNWIVRIFKDKSAEILGQLFYYNDVWMFDKYPSGALFILKKDGSIGVKVNWSKLNTNPKYYQKMNRQ